MPKLLILNLGSGHQKKEITKIVGRNPTDDIVVIDFFSYPDLQMASKRIPRKPFLSLRSNQCLLEFARTRNGLIDELGGFRKDAAAAPLKEYTYENFNLWEAAKRDFYKTLFKRGMGSFLLSRWLDEEHPQRIFLIVGDHMLMHSSEVRELAGQKQIRYTEIHPLSFYRLIQGVKNRLRKFTSPQTTPPTSNQTARETKTLPTHRGGETQKIFAMGFQYLRELETAAPVLQKLNNSHGLFLVLSGSLGETTRILSEHSATYQVSCRMLNDSRNPRVEDKILSAQADLRRILPPPEQITFPPTNSHNLSGFLSPEPWMAMIRYFEQVKQLLETERPVAIVVPNDQTAAQRICCHLATSKGIKIITIPCYTTQITPPHTLKLIEWGHFSAGCWLVIGNAFKKFLVEAGVQPHRITVAGLPKFDVLLKKEGTLPVEEILKQLPVKKTYTGMFLWTLQDLPEENLILEHLTEAMKAFPDKLLVIRPHPLAAHKRLKKLPGDQNVIITKAIGLKNLLMACELLLTTTSLTAFDAVLLDKPVIILNPACRFYEYALLDESAVMEVRRLWETVPAIQKVLFDPEVGTVLAKARKRVVDHYGPPRETPSSERIDGWLAGVLADRNTP